MKQSTAPKRWDQGYVSDPVRVQGINIDPLTIESWHINSVSAASIVTGTLQATTEITVGTPSQQRVALSPQYGFAAYNENGAQTALIACADGSGFFGVDRGIEWDGAGTLTVKAAKVTGLLQAATIQANKITAGDLIVQMGVAVGGSIVIGNQAGQHISIDDSEIAGYNEHLIKQFYLSSVNGKAYAAAGKVVIDADGVKINNGDGTQTTLLRMQYGGNDVGYLSTTDAYGVALFALPSGTGQRYARLGASDANGVPRASMSGIYYPEDDSGAVWMAVTTVAPGTNGRVELTQTGSGNPLLTITADLSHYGAQIGFFSQDPLAAQSTGWTTSNVTTDKTLDADSTSTAELADVVCTLIEALKTYGLLGA